MDSIQTFREIQHTTPGNSAHYTVLHVINLGLFLGSRLVSRFRPTFHDVAGGPLLRWCLFWHHETGSFAPRKPRSYRRLIPSNWVWLICCWSGHLTLQTFENAFVGHRLLDTWMKTILTYRRLAMLSGYPIMSWHGP